MTQEEKQLLLKDLCARLPYGVMCRMNGGGFETIEEDKLTAIGLFQFVEEGLECIPFLRPMSSMTEEEQKELGILFGCIPDKEYMYKPYTDILYSDFGKVVDWLNARHFDYRGLIKKGLALEAPEGMYNF